MIHKTLKMVLVIVVSAIVFLIVALLIDWLAGKIFGTTKNADGTEVLKGGGTISIVLLTISCAATITFGVWFYKLLTSHKISRIRE